MSKVYAFMADGLEEVECLAVVDILRRGSVIVELVSISDHREVTGAHGITVMADRLLTETDVSDADLLFLPGGGGGTKLLGACAALAQELCRAAEKGKTSGRDLRCAQRPWWSGTIKRKAGHLLSRF